MLRYTQNGYDYISIIFITILYLISVYNLMKSLMIKKNTLSNYKLVSVFSIAFIPLYLSSIFLEVLPNFIVHMLITFVLSHALFDSKLGNQIVSTSFSLFLYISFRMIFSFIIVLIYGYEIERSDTIPYLLSSFCILILSNIFKIFPILNHKDFYPFKYMACLSATPLISLLIINNLYLIAPQDVAANSFFSIFTIILLFFLNIIVFKIFDFLILDSDIKKQHALFEQQMKSYTEYITEYDEINKKTIKTQHDLKNQLIYIKGLVENNELNKSVELIDSIICDNTQSNKICGNIVLDSILNSKISIAKRNNIQINYLLEVPTTLPFKETDICILLGNALDNALEATIKNKTNKRIDIFIKYYHKNLVIRIRNHYSNSLQKDPLGKIITSKSEKLFHGFGLKSISKIVNNYNGIMNINDENNIFDMRIVLLST